MAKKIESSSQSNDYLNSLLGNKKITPINQPSSSIPETPARNEYPEAPTPADHVRPGRKKQGAELKARSSFTVSPTDFSNLKRIAFMKEKTISEILGEYIKTYIAENQEDLADYAKLPESVKKRIEASNT